jgi:hypothetical protein
MADAALKEGVNDPEKNCAPEQLQDNKSELDRTTTMLRSHITCRLRLPLRCFQQRLGLWQPLR